MAYCTQQDVENYIGRPLEDSEAGIFPTLEAAVADYIDVYCSRTFSKDRAISFNVDDTIGDKSENPFQRYNGGDVEIFFDTPLQTDTSLKDSDGNSLVITPYIYAWNEDTETSYLLDPYTYVLHPVNQKVKTSVEMKVGVFPYGYENIFVYGTFTDYVTPPKAITQASATIIADTYNTTDNLKSEMIEGYSRTFSNQWNTLVGKILESYKRVVL